MILSSNDSHEKGIYIFEEAVTNILKNITYDNLVITFPHLE